MRRAVAFGVAAVALVSLLSLTGGCEDAPRGSGGGAGGNREGGGGGAMGTGGATPSGTTDTEVACLAQCMGYAAVCPDETNTSVCVPLCTLGALFRTYSECGSERAALDGCQAQSVVPSASCGCTTAACLTGACIPEWNAVRACIRALPPDCARTISFPQQGTCVLDLRCRNLISYQVSCQFVGDTSRSDCTCVDSESGIAVDKIVYDSGGETCDRAAADCGFPD